MEAEATFGTQMELDKIDMTKWENQENPRTSVEAKFRTWVKEAIIWDIDEV